MPDETFTAAPVAAARIWAVYQSVKSMHERTGGDEAEAVYEIVTAAILILFLSRPAKPPAQIIAEIAPLAEITARDWFATEIAKVTHGDH